ncbi:MAG TPA: type IV secretory system conjugative DNA transfer family protein [Chloroflexia bacterium]|nr:type IV secretory system conjugative DNA transfer family protein [Chloroflexia bacterium]
MSTKLQFEEPPILLGETRIGSQLQRFYLPLATATGHTLVISRSGGGKSHTLATLAMGMARAAAIRRLNLLFEVTSQRHPNPPINKKKSNQNAANILLGIVSGFSPLSLCVFDPHRDLAKRLLEDLTRQIAWIRNQRKEQRRKQEENKQAVASPLKTPANTVPNWEDILEGMITYIDLGDRENVFGLNLLDTTMWESKENCASTLIEIFKRIYPDAWGSRMEDVFRHSVFALYLLNTKRHRAEQFTLLDVVPFITIDLWRETLLDHDVIARDNPIIAAWWKIQFADKMSDNFRNEVIKPVLNKLNPFLGSDILSRIFGQAQTTLDFGPLIQQGNIVLIDLAASEIETENCAMAGAILIGFLLKKARHIADNIEQEADRPQVQLMVDEFNVILAAPYADIMGQYRKWGVRATLATQSLTLLDELDPTLRPLVMANAANLLVLQVNAEDAEYLRRELVADGTTTTKSVGLTGFAGSLISPSAGGGGLGPDLYDLVNAERGMCYFKGTFNNIREPVFTVRIAPRPFRNLLQLRPPAIRGEEFSKEKTVIEQERQATLTRILTHCRQKYTFKAEEISLRLNQKQRDYLGLYTLSGLNSTTSELLTGFIEGETELVSGLERRLKVAQNELEAQKMERAKRARRNNRYNQDKDQSEAGVVSGEESENESGNAATGQELNSPSIKEHKNEAKKKTLDSITKPNNVVQLRSDIPPFAPGYAIAPPVRKSVSYQQIFEETRQLPDGNDYSAAAQVKKERAKEMAKKRQRWKSLAEAEAAQQQGQEYARLSQVPGHGAANLDNTSETPPQVNEAL